jgi:hypothetical protein
MGLEGNADRQKGVIFILSVLLNTNDVIDKARVDLVAILTLRRDDPPPRHKPSAAILTLRRDDPPWASLVAHDVFLDGSWACQGAHITTRTAALLVLGGPLGTALLARRVAPSRRVLVSLSDGCPSPAPPPSAGF